MENDYNRFHQQRLHLQYPRTTFLPMFCSRTAIKDVRLPNREDRSASSSEDPLSPKISCMGQVKRNNRVVGFPTSHKLTFTPKSNYKYNNNDSVKYSKLKRFFSGKNLITTTSAATVTTAATTGSCVSRRQVNANGANYGQKSNRSSDENFVSVSIVDLDPPLPVIKRLQKPEGEEMDSLWKRRSGGVQLKTLHLQQIQLPRHHLQPTTV